MNKRQKSKLKHQMVHIEISIRAGFGSVKLPSSKLKSERLTEVFAQNGVRSSDTIPIYEAAGIDPETEEETLLSPQWAKYKLMHDLQDIQETWMISLGEGRGFEVASCDFPAVEAAVQAMIQRCDLLKGVLMQPETWNAAESLYESRINNVFDALIAESEIERDRLIQCDAIAYDAHCEAHTKRVEQYERERLKMLNKFPDVQEFDIKFRVTNSAPVIKASLLQELQGDTHAMKALVEAEQASQDAEFASAIKSARQRALQDYLEAVQDNLEALQSELLDGHILPILRELDSLDARKVSKTAKKSFEKHLERAEKILNMLAASSATAVDAELAPAEQAEANLENLQQIQDATAQLRAAFEESNPKAREDVQRQLAAFKASLRESVAHIQAQGASSLAEWCMIDEVEATEPEIAAPQILVMIDEVLDKPAPAAAPELVAVGGMML